MVAVDEAHLVKNPDAQRTQAVAQLTKGCDYVVLMTGTALENRLNEMLALATLAQPEMEHVFQQMSRMAIEYIQSDDLFEQMAPVYLRRTQQDVLHELPERIFLDNWVIPSDDDKVAYLLSPAQVMSRRLAATRGDGTASSAKYEYLLDLVEEHRQAGRKIVVFSFFRDVINDVCKMLGGIPSITGDVSSTERQKIIDSFASDSEQSVLVLQVDAGGVGINLQFAQVVILMEAQFKPSTEWQAIARVHRMGQSRQVIVHRLLAIGTIEERLVQLLEDKTRIFESYAHNSSVRDASSMATDTGSSIEAQLQKLLDQNPGV
jgi:SNF2 family DNA or RNA helicase